MDTWSGDRAPGEEEEGQVCTLCRGAGFVHPCLDSGQVDFGRVVPCACSRGELTKRKAEYLEKYSNLGALAQLTFDNLSPKGKAASPAAQERFGSGLPGRQGLCR
jgi:DNA replication protein DnaC